MTKPKIILDVNNATGIPALDVDDGLAPALALAGQTDIPFAQGREHPFIMDATASFDFLAERLAASLN